MLFYSPNDISGLGWPKNLKFGIKVTSSTRMMRAIDFLKKFLIVAKFAKKHVEIGQKTPIF